MQTNIESDTDVATLRLVVESAPNALIMVDAHGTIALVNSQAEDLFGYTRVELLGKPIEMLVPERYRTQHSEQRSGFFHHPSKRAMGAGRDLYGLRKDGSEVPVEIGLTPIRMPEGACVLAAVIDITARRRLEQERRESEQRYTNLVEQAIFGIIVRQPDGEIVLVNDAFCRLMGYSREEMLQMKVQEIHRGMNPGSFERINRLKVGESIWTRTRILRKDGSEAHIEGVTHRLTDSNLQSTLFDITERQLTEKARAESEQRYVELVEQAHEGIVVRKSTGQLAFANNAFCEMLGYRRDELLRMNIRDVVHADDLGSVAQVESLQGGERLHLEKRLRHKDGHTLYVEVSVRRLSSGDFQSTFIDISERLRSQEALRAFPKQLLDAQETERRRIARELHDEVGQALTVSQIKLRALEKKLKGNPEASDAAEVVGILTTLLQQVRQLSLDLRPAILDDLGLAAAIRWFVRERIIQSHLEVKLDVPLTLPRFPVRIETAVFRSFQSTMINIIRHAEAHTIQVSLHFEAPRLTLVIRDDGKGFDVEEAQRRARQGGSLGLLGMMEWVRLCGGDMAIESAPGQGTIVRAVILIDEENGKPGLVSKGG